MIQFLKQFIVFCGVGAINTIAGLSIILWLVHHGTGNIVANMTGYAVGLVIGFFLHRTITFREHRHRQKTRTQIAWFLVIFAIGYLTQLACLIIMTKELNWPSMLSQIIACGIYVVIGFAGNRLKTFAK